MCIIGREFTQQRKRAPNYIFIYVYIQKMNILTFHCNCLLFKECLGDSKWGSKTGLLLHSCIQLFQIDQLTVLGTKAHSLGNTKCCQFNKYQTFFNTVLFYFFIFCVVNINSVLDVFLLLYSLYLSISLFFLLLLMFFCVQTVTQLTLFLFFNYVSMLVLLLLVSCCNSFLIIFDFNSIPY